MSINLKIPDIRELKPRITVFGVGGAGGNAVNNMITAGSQGVDFVVANTDAQALTMSKAERIIQMGVQVTEGLGAGSQPDVGRAAAEEVIDEIRDHLTGAHMVFVTAGMGGGTGTGAAPVVARCAASSASSPSASSPSRSTSRASAACGSPKSGITELHKVVDTLLIIPNQNLFRVANEKTTFADAFAMADQVLYSGVACITDLMVKEGLINLDFADVRAVMREMGKAMMGTGEASGDKRALRAAEAAISNPLIDDVLDEGRPRPADLDHRRQGSHALRGRRGRHPHPRGGRSGRQHHRRRDLRREPRRHHPGVGGGDRHRSGRLRTSGHRRPRPAWPRSPTSCGSISSVSAERVERTELTRPVASPAPAMAPAPAQAPAHAPMSQGVESAARAAVAAAVLPITSIEDVTIRPMQPKPSLFPGAGRAANRRRPSRLCRAAFIPPPPERAGQSCAAHAEHRRVADAGPERAARPAGRRTGGRASGKAPDEPAAAPRHRRPRPPGRGRGSARDAGQSAAALARLRGPRSARRSVRRRGRRRRADPTRCPTMPGVQPIRALDPHGRQGPVHNAPEEDHLDIPAFLRRQAT